MKHKGVCYDVGRVMMGRKWRPAFNPEIVRRELEIIKNDLHCNVVRICGLDIDRLTVAAEYALDCGLNVWLSPEMWDRSQQETLDYVAKAAASAEHIGDQATNDVVFSVGSELTLFMEGIVEGNNVFERMVHPSFLDAIREGTHNAPLNAFLANANDVVRNAFDGKVTYASVPFETVDWSQFDIVCVDLYRDKRIRDGYANLLKRWFAFDKPVVIGEVGCCTFRGAEDFGGMGWDIIDATTTPPTLKDDYVYDQGAQARELSDLLCVLDDAGVDGAFVFTFVQPLEGFADEVVLKEISFDPDIAAYGLVKSFIGAQHGTTYPDMPWEPKESFKAVADYYVAH